MDRLMLRMYLDDSEGLVLHFVDAAGGDTNGSACGGK